MTLSRRGFLAGTTAAAVGATLPFEAEPARLSRQHAGGFDPWVEVSAEALRINAVTVARLAGERPVLAVIKNNAYGLGLATVASVLEPLSAINGFAVVKTDEALSLREAGIRKPVLLMGLFSEADLEELIRRDITLSLTTEESSRLLDRVARRLAVAAPAQIYLDTGMSRMGVPYHRALPWLAELAGLRGIRVEGIYMGFTEEPDFDREQLDRFMRVTATARGAGLSLGPRHAASSHAVFNFSEAHLDQVRPGIALFGAYPSDEGSERDVAELRPALRLRARVVRVERLRAGDSVSYGRRYVAQRPTWVATLPVGHADGYPRQAVNGARVLINGQLYPAIGAISASHTIVELGEEASVAIGDEATLLGPDDPAIHPNAIASGLGVSVYDVLMHLNPLLPKRLT